MTKETPLLIKGSDTTITDQPTDRPTDTAGYRCFGAPKKKTKERKRSKEPREMFENKTRSFRLGEGKKKGSGYCALYKKREHRRRNEKSEIRRKGMLRILSWETEESLGQWSLRTLQVTRSAISSRHRDEKSLKQRKKNAENFASRTGL